MQLPQITEVRGMRVLTTRQIAEAYEADIGTIQYNFRYNKKRYILGKHYIEVAGDELRSLKTRSEFHSSLKYAKSAYLWTEKGALLHAKSLNTDKAWEVYDYLVDFYFRAKEEQIEQPGELTYREKREKALAETRAREAEKRTKEISEKNVLDIAPCFREVISVLQIEALDEMEKSFRGNNNRAIKLAATSILAEKMKRQLK